MPLINGCCCWDSLEKGSRNGAYFTILTSLIDLIVGIWVIVEVHILYDTLYENELLNFFPPGIHPLLYIDVGMKLISIFLSIFLLIGLNNDIRGRKNVWSWIIGLTIFRCYEILIGVYALTWLGAHRISDIVFIHTYLIMLTVYWAIATLILGCAIVCTVSYWQQLEDDVYGPQRRLEKWKRMLPMRIAASTSTLALARSQVSLGRISHTSHGSHRTWQSEHQAPPIPQKY